MTCRKRLNNKITSLLIFLFWEIVNVNAQSIDSLTLEKNIKKDSVTVLRKSISLEAGGKAIYYSFNYERYIKCGNNNFLSFGIGFGVALTQPRAVFVPLEINYIIKGKKRLDYELGLGQTIGEAKLNTFFNYENATNGRTIGITYLKAGIRYNLKNDKVYLKANVYGLWNSVFVSDNRDWYWTYEKRDYYSDETRMDNILKSIIPYLGLSIGYNIYKKVEN